LQSVYLTELPEPLAEILMGLIGQELTPLILAAQSVKPVSADDLEYWERKIELDITEDTSLQETERIAIVKARIGQGIFKDRVSLIESKCRVTGVVNPAHLIASHCKPWRDSTNQERLNGENGLLLTPSIDHLFDRGFIGFENNGVLIISPVAHRASLQRMGVEIQKIINVGGFTSGQKKFLDFHRNSVFLQSIR
jgi:hypothetical protein